MKPGFFSGMLSLFVFFSLSVNAFTQSGIEVCFRHTLKKVRNESKVPALGAVLVFDGQIKAAGAYGLRKEGSNIAVTDNDRFPIGSISKTFTALVVAKAIQNTSIVRAPGPGQIIQAAPLSWSTKIQDIFPSLAQEPGIQAAYLGKSLAELTTHQAGLPGNGDESSSCDKSDFEQYMFCGRMEHMKKNLKLVPQPAVDYSNLGPVIATNMIQKRMNKTWEELVAQYIYNPLKMNACFVSTYDYNAVKDPMFHTNNGQSNLPVPYSEWDRYNVAAPAGHIAISAADMGKYLIELMPGAPGRVGILTNPNLNLYLSKLNENRQVARGGWIVTQRNWAPGQQVLWHNGSHGKNYAHAWLVPNSQFGFCAMTNVQGHADIGSVAVGRMNENLKLMYLNRNLLPLYNPQMEVFNYSATSSNPFQSIEGNLHDGELATTWKSLSANSWVDINVAPQAGVIGLALCYKDKSHNIKEISISTIDDSNTEKLLYKGAPGEYRNIYQFTNSSIKGKTIRLRFLSVNNQSVEICEIMTLQNTQHCSQFLNAVPQNEKTVIALPMVIVNPN